MKKRDWVNHVREAFAAVTAGAQFVPLGDNVQARHALAVRLAELRVNAMLGGAAAGSSLPRHPHQHPADHRP